MLTKKEFSILSKIFKASREQLHKDIKGLKEETHGFHEDILDVMALVKLQHQLIQELDQRVEKLEKIIFSTIS